jgi:hypothetical protein
MVMLGCCATSSPEAENDMSRKTTSVIKKSMKGTSGMLWSTPFLPPPATFSWTKWRGILWSRTLPGFAIAMVLPQKLAAPREISVHSSPRAVSIASMTCW